VTERAKSLVGFAAGLLAAGCTSPTSALEPLGPGAALIADLWWLMFWLALPVGIVVTGLLLFAIFRGWRGRVADGGPPVSDTAFIVVGGIVVPAVILLLLVVATLRTGAALSTPPDPAALRIDVVGHQFWWEVRYPDDGVVTANEVHIPVGQSVEILLTSPGVIHSFWVPSLNGKQDMNPGETNVIRLRADEPGVYRGLCAEFCGVQHALMQFLVVAQPPAEFAGWIAERRRPPAPPADATAQEGRRVYAAVGCASCHRVAGQVDAGAAGSAGPDLSHLATRRTLAAAIVDNTRANRAAFILDPHAIKPGNSMPPTDLHGEELQALLAYLDTLR
jgi:cytochrome c oxidase subunit II